MKFTVGTWMGRLVLGMLVASSMGLSGCMAPEEAKARHIDKADAYMQAGDHELARVEYLNALKIDANDPRARLGAGQAFEAMGSLQQALGHYFAAAEADPGHVPSRVALARLLALGQDAGRASTYVDQILALEPDNAEGLGLKASVLAIQGNLAGAQEYARRSVRADPANKVGLPLLASMLMNEGQTEEALGQVFRGIAREPADVSLRRVYAQMLLQAGRFEEYLMQLEKIVGLQPDEIGNVLAYASALTRAGRGEEARRLLESRALTEGAAVELQLGYLAFLQSWDPDAVEPAFDRVERLAEDPERIRAAWAGHLLGSGREAEAESVLLALAESDSQRISVDARTSLAELYIGQGRLDQARGIVDAVRESNPTNQAALVLSSMLSARAGALGDTIADLRLAIRDAPDAVGLRRLLATSYRMTNQLELAIQELRVVLELAPLDPGSLDALADIHLGRGQFDEALAVADRMIVNPSTSQLGLQHKYRALVGLERLDEAADIAAQLANVAPRSGVGPFLAGAVAQLRGDDAAAELHYRESLDRQPGAREPLATLARTLIGSGRLDEARALLSRQAELAPDNLNVVKFQGDVEAAAGQYQTAERFYRQALGRDAGFVLGYRGLAAVALERGDWPSARRAYEEGVRATSEPTLILEFALQLQSRGDEQTAKAVYRTGLEAHPANDAMANNLAMLVAEEGGPRADLDTAYQRIAHFARSNDPAHLDTLGWLQFRRGALADAVTYLRRAVALAPESALVRYHLALALVEVGDERAALEHLEIALDSRHRFAGRENAQRVYQRLYSS